MFAQRSQAQVQLEKLQAQGPSSSHHHSECSPFTSCHALQTTCSLASEAKFNNMLWQLLHAGLCNEFRMQFPLQAVGTPGPTQTCTTVQPNFEPVHVTICKTISILMDLFSLSSSHSFVEFLCISKSFKRNCQYLQTCSACCYSTTTYLPSPHCQS